MKTTNKFKFNYSAPTNAERKEIESIRQSYLNESPSNEKLTKLRKLDHKVRQTPTTIAISFGIICTLIFGLGMTMVLEWHLILWGCIVGFVGFVPLLFTYPIFNALEKHYKAKYSNEILKLSEELLNDENKEL